QGMPIDPRGSEGHLVAICEDIVTKRRGCCSAEKTSAPSAGGTPSALGVLLQEFDRVAHGQDRFGGIIGDFATELLLEGHDELDGIERVRAEVVDEARVLRDLVGLDA